MKIFAILEDIDGIIVPTAISLTPFKKLCYYIDLDKNNKYSTIGEEGEYADWKIWNGTFKEYTWYDPITKTFGDEDTFGYSRLEKCIDGYKYQKYKNGLPIGEPYFIE